MGASGTNILKAGQRDKSSESEIVPPKTGRLECIVYVYPDMWKLANVTPIFKKGDKQLIKNSRQISFLPICGKIFEKYIF